MTRIEEILNFWFGDLDDNTLLDKDSPIVKRWFARDEKFDHEIHVNFEEDLIRAREGKYQGWEGEPLGRLALIILFDQFSRNLYRNSPKAFENDLLALSLTLRSIKEQFDHALPLVFQIFLYMPLMHAEDLKIQKLSLECFGKLLAKAKEKTPQNISYYEYTFNFAKRHCDTIEKFGRFPHRNSTLKRTSTPQELAFLRKPTRSF